MVSDLADTEPKGIIKEAKYDEVRFSSSALKQQHETRSPLNILKQYGPWPALKRPTLSILFLRSCKISPSSTGETSGLYVRGSEPPLLFKDRPDHRQGRSAWQPLANLQSASLATDQTIDRKEREREGGVIYSGVLITPQRSCGFIQTWLERPSGASAPCHLAVSLSKRQKGERGLRKRAGS